MGGGKLLTQRHQDPRRNTEYIGCFEREVAHLKKKKVFGAKKTP